ncbi:hypothetical protein OVA21_15435 [Dietzia sp. SL131]|uniref:hypothetical protein n=1 Tax=Dietzia sp. SL131 TaxID=2995149 RepID=UPI00227AA9D6|nr:hypothetical protein [Dietzia sp. SL131]MCY1658573.1 hypothetical protein [Dietzia sp. SL131]
MANLDASAKGQLGVHAPIAVGTAGLEVDLADEISKHHVPNAALGRWPLSVFVEPGLGYTQDPAGDLYGTPFRGDHFDRRVPTFGAVSSFNNSTARWVSSPIRQTEVRHPGWLVERLGREEKENPA